MDNAKLKQLVSKVEERIKALEAENRTLKQNTQVVQLEVKDNRSTDTISAINQSFIELKKLISQLIDLEKQDNALSPKPVIVENFPEVSKEVTVSNFGQFPLPRFNFPKELRISNLDEIKWPEDQDLASPVLPDLFDPKHPLAVRLSDGEKFINQLRDSLQHVVTSGGSGSAATVQELQVINSLVPNKYDYVAVTTPSATQEVYTFRLGGVAGSVVSTVTINYTDSTKVTLLNISKA